MFPFLAHDHDDTDPKRARCFASAAEIARSFGGNAAVRLPAEGDSREGRAADNGGVARPFGSPLQSNDFDSTRRSNPRGTRSAVIVVASALLESLLRRPAAQAIQTWLFDSGTD